MPFPISEVGSSCKRSAFPLTLLGLVSSTSGSDLAYVGSACAHHPRERVYGHVPETQERGNADSQVTLMLCLQGLLLVPFSCAHNKAPIQQIAFSPSLPATGWHVRKSDSLTGRLLPEAS